MKKPKKKRRQTRGVIWFENISKTRRVRLSWNRKQSRPIQRINKIELCITQTLTHLQIHKTFELDFPKTKKKTPARLLLPSIPVTWGLKSRQI